MARTRFFILVKVDLTRCFGLRTLGNCSTTRPEIWQQQERKYSTATTEDEKQTEATVNYVQGLPHLTVPLPSRNEKCRFVLKPVSHCVGDFLEMLKFEDRGIDRAAVLNCDGIRIASSCTIESLMDEPFWLHVNDKQYLIQPPKRERICTEELNKLGDVRALVAQLYEALHVGEYHIKKEKQLLGQLEELKYQIAPLEVRKQDLDVQAIKRTNIMTWLGLGLMSVQFGILARLTWWEYSWDIMEPVTYFVTYGTAMAAYAYFCITKQDYQYPEVRDRQYLISIHKRAKKEGFDMQTYNILRRQIAEIEYDLRRLHDPLNLQLPPKSESKITNPMPNYHPKTQQNYLTDETIRTTMNSSSKLQIVKVLNNIFNRIKK